jgi:hypothetical protein
MEEVLAQSCFIAIPQLRLSHAGSGETQAY